MSVPIEIRIEAVFHLSYGTVICFASEPAGAGLRIADRLLITAVQGDIARAVVRGIEIGLFKDPVERLRKRAVMIEWEGAPLSDQRLIGACFHRV